MERAFEGKKVKTATPLAMVEETLAAAKAVEEIVREKRHSKI
jgi:hypothetical protein